METLIFAKFLESGLSLEGFSERYVENRRNEFGYLVHVSIGHAKGATYIPDNSSRLHSAEGGDLGNPILAEMFRNILQDPVPAIHAKINVDVWQAKPFNIEKALEDQAMINRIEIGNAKAISHQAASRRPPPRADRYRILSGKPNEICDYEKVGAKSHLLDDRDLVGQPVTIFFFLLSAEVWLLSTNFFKPSGKAVLGFPFKT